MEGKSMLKKPKVEISESSSSSSSDGDQHQNKDNNNFNRKNGDFSEGISGSNDDYEEQEEALVALFEHRTKEVEHLRNRITYYTTQLKQAEQRLQDTKHKLARVRGKICDKKSNQLIPGHKQEVNIESRANSLGVINEGSSHQQPQSKPPLVIQNVSKRPSIPTSSVESGRRASPVHPNSPMKSRSRRSPEPEKLKEAVGTKRKLEHREHKELVPIVRSSPSPSLIHCHTSSHISSQHKRKLRSLSLCPVNDKLFITSALDGVVNLWQLQARGSGATCLRSMNSLSPKQRRWPEDITWHPEGNKLLAVYTADGGDDQISVLNLNKRQSNNCVSFLEEKPHVKGIINSLYFMPWEETCFATGGSDHAVVIWNEKDREDNWKPKALHRNIHSSAVMGVAGMQHKQMVLSAGADRRIIGYDVLAGRADYKYQIESKCMSVLPNPCDFNIFVVQTGTPERQLRLFDIRLRQSELHSIGWKQESSESQSALINQAWSPDGLYISSGSADPVIHIFDIRYNSLKPSQSVKAHQKRVFKAEWHASMPLLISISSDLNIGLHKF